MRITILLLTALLTAYLSLAQGSKAQVDTHSEATQGSGASQNSVPRKSKLNSINDSASWNNKKKGSASANNTKYSYNPAISNKYTKINADVINHYFKENMIMPSPSTAQLLLNQNAHAPVASTQSSSTEAAPAASPEKMFTNEQATISSIYPNPASGYAFIDYSLAANVREGKLVIYNVLGTPISEYVLDKEEKKLRISTFNWDSGFYYYTFFVDGKSLVTRRLVVKRF